MTGHSSGQVSSWAVTAVAATRTRTSPGPGSGMGTSSRLRLAGSLDEALSRAVEVKGVRLGKIIELDVDALDPSAARARVVQMCEKLLANTVIEEYRVEAVG